MIEEIQRKKVMQMIIMAVKTLHPHQKKTDVVMLFLSLCVNNRCQTENNNISRHLWVKYEYRQLEVNVPQKNPYKNTLYYICLNPRGSV